MPTATHLAGYGFLNNGPLTTTFTPPASCSTRGVNTGVAFTTAPSVLLYEIDCTSTRPLDCTPAGPVITSLNAAWNAGNAAAEEILPYYSPGLNCPAGWTTAGDATKINPTSSVISGAAFNFNVTAVIPSGLPLFQDPWSDALLSALDPSETAVACCPDSFSWGVGGNCYSTIPTSIYAPTTGCQRIRAGGDDVFTAVSGTWTIRGETITAAELQVTATYTTGITTEYTTFKPTETPDLIAGAVVAPFVLVHKASDKAGDGSGDGSGGGKSGDGGSGDKTGAATRVGDSASVFGLLAAASCAILALGTMLAL